MLIQVDPALFPDGVPRWPIGDTRRASRSRRADFPARLCGLAAARRVRFVRQTKKIPDAVFRTSCGCARRGRYEGVSHLFKRQSTPIGGLWKENRRPRCILQEGRASRFETEDTSKIRLRCDGLLEVPDVRGHKVTR